MGIDNMCEIKRISDYNGRYKGCLELKANTKEELDKAIEELFERYPFNPYESSVEVDKVNLTAHFYHWGSD